MKPEAAKRQIRAIKGVRDILPPESALWNRVEQTARDVFATYGYGEIRLPIFEPTELFARAIGEETDIVSKEIFTWFEGTRSPETEFALLWLRKHRPEVRDYEYDWAIDPDRKFRIDLLVRTENSTLLVEFKRFLSRDSLDRLRSYRDLFQAANPGSARPDVRLVVPGPIGGARSKNLLMLLAIQYDIQIEELEIEDYEEPQSLTLRPEATASVCRAYIEHGMHTLPGDVKLYYIGPMFRRERPQKGRYRQFYQIGAEVLGQSDVPAIDAEVIEMLIAFFDRVGLAGCTLHLNSIGCRECRPKYVEKLREALLKVKDKLGPDSQRRIETNPLRVLDSKLPEEQPIIEKLPRIGEHLCAACREHFAALQEQLKLRGISYEISWRLVRGLDYYMRTTFEITAPGLGAQNAVCGGGRYDGLVELLGGPPTKGIGFAIGTDRVVLSLQESGKAAVGLAITALGTAQAQAVQLHEQHEIVPQPPAFTPDEDFWLPPRPQPAAQVVKPFTDNDVLPAAPVLDVLIAWMGAAAYLTAVKLARRLRGEGFSVELPAEEMKLKKSLGLADKLGARYAVILGENEVASGRFTVKRLVDAQQQELSENQLVELMRGKL